MTDVADLMVRFLALCDEGPAPDPREFAAQHAAAGAELIALLEDALAVQRFLGSGRAVPNAATPAASGRYRILRELGRGAYGVVYLAEQDAPRRQVALKTLHAHIASGEVLKRFEREALILGKLHHPGIAAIYEAGIADERPWLALELVDGAPLTEGAAALGLDLSARVLLLRDVAIAVQHAHEQGVLHRDLKPGNILLDRSGRPKVLDFGMARLAGRGSEHAPTLATATSQWIGTPYYMSPEQARGRADEIDAQSDVYALGVIGYELLAGRLPHDFGDSAQPEVLRTICEDDPIPLGRVDRRFKGDLETVLGTALAKEKYRRYGSAAELAEELERWLEKEPIRARRPTAAYRLARFAQRNRGLVTGLAAAALALVAAVVGLFAALVQARKASAVERGQRVAVIENSLAMAAQRGDWRQVLSDSDALHSLGLADDPALAVRRCEALANLGKRSDARQVLDALLVRPDLGRLAGKVSLLEADWFAIEPGAQDRFAPTVRRALELGLGPADAAYARGLVADSTPAAIEAFGEALGFDPAHLQARTLRMLCSLLLGRVESVADDANVLALLRPDDPTPGVALLLSATLAGNAEAAARARQQVDQQLDPELVDALFGLLREIEAALETLRTAASPEAVTVKWVPALVALAAHGQRLLRSEIDPAMLEDLARRGASLPFLGAMLRDLPPAIVQTFGDQDTSDAFQEIVDRHPEGVLYFLKARAEFLRADSGKSRDELEHILRTSAAYYRASLRADWLVAAPRRTAVSDLIGIELMLGYAKHFEPDPAMREAAERHFAELFAEGALDDLEREQLLVKSGLANSPFLRAGLLADAHAELRRAEGAGETERVRALAQQMLSVFPDDLICAEHFARAGGRQ